MVTLGWKNGEISDASWKVYGDKYPKEISNLQMNNSFLKKG